MIQGRNFSSHNGIGGEITYGEKFKDENGHHFQNSKDEHGQEGLLSMANAGPQYNWVSVHYHNSSEIILMENVVFGQLIEGVGITRMLDNVEVSGKKKKKPCQTLCCNRMRRPKKRR